MEKYPDLENKHYVYCHYRGDNGKPFYIGVGKSKDNAKNDWELYGRAKAKSKRSSFWKNIVDKHGYTIEILQENLTREQSREKEIEFIAIYKRTCDGGTLCNITLGGDGVSGFPHTDETKRKLSEATAYTDCDLDINIYPEPNTGCFLWAGQLESQGRPFVFIKQKGYLGHRYFYQREKSIVLSKKDFLISTCGNKLCVNPDHYFIGSQKDVSNTRIRNKRASGESQYQAKLTDNIVREAKTLYSFRKVTFSQLAKKYGVCRQTIEAAVLGKTWKHVV